MPGQPPVQTPFFDEGKRVAYPWMRWFQQFSAHLPVTGSRASGAALTNLLEVLAKQGIIIDKTVP